MNELEKMKLMLETLERINNTQGNTLKEQLENAIYNLKIDIENVIYKKFKI